ncbi:phage tail tape measure protein [Bacillus circulans]|uniref:phage tail tape measure protein n=1 Tax=Niallia circulans TaxID=1397 RepID=UPI00155F7F2F|nr:phage tail tape measure protein [Niallia circulans]NRG26137.1 phage tail tape measure protein [Niallia circulans]
MADHSIVVELGANITGLTRGLQTATNQLTNFSDRLGGMGQKLTSMGKTMTGFGVATAAGLGFAVKSAADFDTEMRKAGAIAGANTKEFDAMKQAAIDLGANTSKSASEVATAMTELAAKGFDANQTIAAMPGIISAAEASGEDLALTSDTVATALNVWGLEASEASKVADVLAQSANTSAAGINDISYALKYAGAPAAALGVSMEELTGAIGLMVDSGLDGSNAGTALRASLLALLNPSEKNSKMMESMGIAITDAKGNFVGLSGLVDNLSKSMEGQTETQKAATLASLVGTEAVSGFMALMEAGPKKIDKVTASLENSAGASQEAANKMKAGIGGSLEQLSGAFESLAISIGDQLVPTVSAAANFLADLVNKFNGLSDGVKQVLVVSAALVAGLLLLGGPFLMIIGFIPNIIIGMNALAAATKAVGSSMSFLLGPWGLVIAAVVGLGAAFVIAYQKVEWFRDMVNGAWEFIKNTFSSALNFIKNNVIVPIMSAVSTFVGEKLAELRAFWAENGAQIVSLVKNYFTAVGTTIKMVMGIVKGIFQVVWPFIANLTKVVWSGIKTAISNALALIQGVIKVGLALLRGDWEGAWTSIKDTAKTIMDNMISFFKGIDLKSIGKDMISGLINGISSMGDSIKTAVKKLADLVPKGLKDFFGIHSPSRLMKNEIGRFIPEGVAEGITGNIKSVINATKNMAKMMMPEAMSATLAYETPAANNGGIGVQAQMVASPAGGSASNARVEKLLEQLLQKDQSLVINGREFAVATYDDYDTYGGTKVKLAERWD